MFDFETGLRVVAERARLMQTACEQTSGTMASVIGEEPAKVEALCREFDIEIANLNCPGQIVVSGETSKVTGPSQREAYRSHENCREPPDWAAWSSALAGGSWLDRVSTHERMI